MASIKDIIKMFPDWYTDGKKEGSNLWNFLQPFAEQFDSVVNDLQTMRLWNNIDNAKGAELDKFGKDIGQPRGKATDEQYRVMLKGKREEALGDGTWNSVVNSIARTLNAKPSDISIGIDPNEPLGLILKKVPLQQISDAGLTVNQLIQIINRFLEAEARVSQANFLGTFRFATDSIVREYGDGGFNHGTWSIIYQPGNEEELPI